MAVEWRELGASTWRAGFLVGRLPELQTLLDAVASPPSVVVVEGEPGIGKSRLVAELIEHPACASHARLIGRCESLREPFPYAPVVDALRALARELPRADQLPAVTGALAPLLPELATVLPAAPLADDAGAQRHNVFRGMRELLGSLGPTVLVLEDLHWADEGTADLLRFLVPRMPSELTAVLTFRREDLAEGSALRSIHRHVAATARGVKIALAPLDASEVGTLVGAILRAQDVSAQLAEFVHEKTEGLPFAVEEVIRLLVERGDILRHEGRWARGPVEDMQAPPGITDAIAERLTHLDADARAVVAAASVLAAAAQERALAAVSGTPKARIARAVSKATRAGLLKIFPDGSAQFRHALTQQAVYESLEPAERRALHLRAARSLRSRSPRPVAQIAHHLFSAGEDARAAAYAEKAGDIARDCGDDASAVKWYARAIEVAGLQRADVLRLAQRLGTASLGAAAYENPIRILESIHRAAGLSTAERAEIAVNQALLLLQGGRSAEGYPLLAGAVNALDDRRIAVVAMFNLGVPWTRAGTLAEHIEWARRAVNEARALGDEALLQAKAQESATLLACGDPREWETIMNLGPAGASPAAVRQRMFRRLNVAQIALVLGHDARAAALHAEALRLSRSSEFGSPRALAAVELLLDWHAGRWEGIEARARAVADDIEDSPVSHVDALVVGPMAALARGRVEAEAELVACLNRAWKVESLDTVFRATAALGHLRLHRGDRASVTDLITAAVDVLRSKNAWVWSGVVSQVFVETLVRAGAIQDAEDLFETLRESIVGRDAPAASISAMACEALLVEARGSHADASQRFREAAEAWRVLPRPYECAQALEAAGRCAIECAEESGADLLVEALSTYGALGASWDAARARALCRAHGVALPYPWRGGRRAYGDQLSPREEDVIRLLRLGQTNREIAKTLVLSQRTVEAHLSSAMRKLGARSRLDLVRRDQGGQS